MSAMRVLVATERTADQRKTLAAVRALARAGAAVTVGSDRVICQPAWSRHCHRHVVYPSPVDEPHRFVEYTLRLLAEDPHNVLLPLSDYTTLVVADNREAYERLARVPIAHRHALEVAYDKLRALALADRLGIATPRTYCPDSEDEVLRIAAHIDYPCVFKLRTGAGGVGLRFPRDADELLVAYRDRRPDTDPLFTARPPLIQQRIIGPVHDVCLLFNRGRVRAAMTQERLVMRPSQGGVGVYNRSTDMPELRDQAVTLLEALDWHGPAMVEFRRDQRDGRFYLMEINARFWGTLDLAIQAGIDFPTLACRIAVDGDVEPVFEYIRGLEYRWSAMHVFRHAAASDRILRSLWSWFRPSRRRHTDMWFSDPLPLVASLLMATRRAITRAP